MRIEDYNMLSKQLKELIATDSYYLPVLSNAAAILWDTLPDINWSGFYIVRSGILVLGPFQGKPACIHIQKSRGVCGTAWEKDATQRVVDVHSFPGHIACDSASKSEIVIPIHRGGEVVAVMDIDSPVEGRFDDTDQTGLEAFARVIEEDVEW